METTLITGASSGIGRALSFEFAKGGSNLVLVARDISALEETAAEIKKINPSVHITNVSCDLAEQGAAEKLSSDILGRGIEIDNLVNDAGQGELGEVAHTPLERHLEVIRLNVDALVTLTRRFLPAMLARKHGKILNVGSIAGFQPGPLMAVYHGTKAFVNSFSEALQDELKDTDITVTCLAPGPTATDFFNKADMQDTRVVQHSTATMMNPQEVARAGYDGLMSGDRMVVPGAMNKLLTFSRRLMPLGLQAKVQRSFYEHSTN